METNEMNGKGKKSEQERRDWTIILIILLFGFLCVIIAGQWAIRFSPRWQLDTNMQSNLDPNSDFLTNRPIGFFEPLDPSILTQPAWMNIFLTPGAVIATRTPPPSSNITDTPAATNTPIPTAVTSPTPINQTATPTVTAPSPTNTFIYYPPPPATATRTSPPANTSVPTTSVPPTAVTPPTAITPSTPLPVDLGITKTDGVTTYTAGLPITYTITVTNSSSNAVTGATISDSKPAQVTTWGWCAGICTPTVFNSANINITFNLGANASATFTVQANIDSAATGSLSNTATVSVPSGYMDTNGGNNSANDTDIPATLSADIAIDKTSSTSTYTPGSTVTYTVTIANNGPNVANGVTLQDAKPSLIDTWTWTCVQNGGATGCDPVTNSDTDFSDTVNLPNGGNIVYSVTATINGGATGNLQNTATRTVPSNVNDTVPGNDTASYTHTWSAPSVDLSITKDDGVAVYSPGGTLTYTIVVRNNGSATASGFNITDNIPVIIYRSLSVSCVPSGSSDSCGTNNTMGTGIVYNNATLSAGETLTITINLGLSLWQTGTLSNTANIVIPGGALFSDPNAANNSALDSDGETAPSCGVIIDISGTGSYAISNGQVTCLRFTDPTLTQGAVVDISNAGTTYLRWTGLPEGGSGICDLEQGLLWMIDNNLNSISIDRNTDIIIYVQALFGGDTLTISSITDWTTGCP